MLLPPDVEAVLERGRHATLLLENDTFLAVVDDLTNYHLAALVAAPPGARGADARDYHHGLQHALSAIVADLKGRIEVAEQLRANIQEELND